MLEAGVGWRCLVCLQSICAFALFCQPVRVGAAPWAAATSFAGYAMPDRRPLLLLGATFRAAPFDYADALMLLVSCVEAATTRVAELVDHGHAAHVVPDEGLDSGSLRFCRVYKAVFANGPLVRDYVSGSSVG